MGGCGRCDVCIWCAGGWCLKLRGSRGAASPETFRISCTICAWSRSNHSLFSFIIPFPRGFVIIIMSPLSCTCSFLHAAYLYTSCLFPYSTFVRDMLHLISPLYFLIPSYSCRLLALEGHSTTSRCSPGGAFTLVHPVHKVKSVFRCFYRASFHCSRSP